MRRTLDRTVFQFSVMDLIVVVGLTSLVLGAFRVFGICGGLFGGLTVSAASCGLVRRRAHRIAAGVFTLSFGLLFVLPWLDLVAHGPYVIWYNNYYLNTATRASLIGKPEGEVRRVLGAPTFTYEGWNRWSTETGEPTADAEYGRTYNYAPYAWLPFAKFQVHCRDGIVQSVEQFDD
jgi:hypothetical protein